MILEEAFSSVGAFLEGRCVWKVESFPKKFQVKLSSDLFERDGMVSELLRLAEEAQL